MHLSKDIHVLSNTIIKIAFVNVCAEALNSAARMLLTKSAYSEKPDMLNNVVFVSGIVIYLISFVLNVMFFVMAQKKLKFYESLFSVGEMKEIEELQKEYIPSKISTLPLSMISTLLRMWAVILLGISVVYEITGIVYRNFIEGLTGVFDLSDAGQYLAYVNVYNQTHGFKYIGMLIAVIIGIVLTGIALKDKFIRIVAGEIMAVFLATFIFIGQTSMNIAGRMIGVVWTSVIYHLIETVGLIVFALYLRKRYKGI